jgi:hypothetical protein
MTTEPLPLTLTGLTLLLASVLHSAAGFAFALFAIPVFLFLGWQPYQAIALCAVSVVVHGCLSIWRSNERFEWKQLIGLIAVLAVKAWLKPQPRERLHPAWGVLTMVTSGVIAGLSGMGGPPIVLWLIAHKWSNEKIRVTLWAIFSSLAAGNLCWLLWRFGTPVSEASLVGLLFTPVTLLGTVPGAWIAGKMSPGAMRRVATVILMIVALYALLQPVVFPDLARSP